MPYSTYSPITPEMKSQLDAISSQYFDNTLRKVVYQNSVLFDRLRKKSKIKIKGGRVIQWPIRVDTLEAGAAVDPREDMTWSTKDTRIAAQVPWKYYWTGTFINWDELLENTGKPQLVDLVKDKSEELKEDFQELFITHLYDTTGTPDIMQIDPLDVLIGTGAYAGVDPTGLTDATRWRSQVDATSDRLYFFDNTEAQGTTGDVSENTLAQMINKATHNNKKPSVIITTEDIYTGIEAYLEKQKRITRDRETEEMGYENVKFKNIPIVPDKRCPDGYVFGIDEEALDLIVHPKYDMAVTGWEPHEKRPNSLYKGISWAGNFRLAYRHTCFKMTGIASVEKG